MEVRRSARKHRAGNMLEIAVLLLDDGDALVIHAMRMRPKYRDLLP